MAAGCPPHSRHSQVKLLTEHSEDGRRRGAAGAVAILGAAVVRTGIGAGGSGEQEAAAGSLEEQGPIQIPGEAGVRPQAEAAPAA